MYFKPDTFGRIVDLPVTPQIQLVCGLVSTEQWHVTMRMTSLSVMSSFTLLLTIGQGTDDVSGKWTIT
jgi:hypothetical protein